MAEKTKTRKPDVRKKTGKGHDSGKGAGAGKGAKHTKPGAKKDDGVKRRPQEEPRRMPGKEEEESWELEDEE